ncbi:DUF4258 domain-containing protein [Patescibacteria group bacterium]|nr:DUF4258 domain-containing protein [Patescibacteria group bacterium]
MNSSTQYRELIFTTHALTRLKERQLSRLDVWYTWRRPDKTQPGRSPQSWKYTKSKNDQTIQVIAKKNERQEWIVLSVWSKRKGNNRPFFVHQSLLEKLLSLFTKD